MTQQLPLDITVRESASFANYIFGKNDAIYEILQQLISGKGENSIYLWGTSGTGKTHLLQAICQQVAQYNNTPAYISLNQLEMLTPDILEGLETLDLVCIDDIHCIAGQTEWEQALFHLFNRLQDNHVPLIMTAHVSPKKLNLHLPDLTSRLTWGGVFQLQPLTDEEKVDALQKHASVLGLTLSAKVARYLLQHCSRDMPTLMEWLQRLDYASLSHSRKLTLPFVRQLLAQNDTL